MQRKNDFSLVELIIAIASLAFLVIVVTELAGCGGGGKPKIFEGLNPGVVSPPLEGKITYSNATKYYSVPASAGDLVELSQSNLRGSSPNGRYLVSSDSSIITIYDAQTQIPVDSAVNGYLACWDSDSESFLYEHKGKLYRHQIGGGDTLIEGYEYKYEDDGYATSPDKAKLIYAYHTYSVNADLMLVENGTVRKIAHFETAHDEDPEPYWLDNERVLFKFANGWNSFTGSFVPNKWGVYVINTKNGNISTVLSGSDPRYSSQLDVTSDGRTVVFLSDNALYLASIGNLKFAKVVETSFSQYDFIMSFLLSPYGDGIAINAYSGLWVYRIGGNAFQCLYSAKVGETVYAIAWLK